MTETRTDRELVLEALGQIAALGAAVNLLITQHPQRDPALQAVRGQIDVLLARSTRVPMLAPYFRGLLQARDLFLQTPRRTDDRT